ncbi:MAG TPA: M20/M25/M40 family metallo-hydrolase, partial [Chloroflexi bacterium]|nr:M20/M25/M40 family metallo-hydrolase [Chloroflexota bacterium]
MRNAALAYAESQRDAFLTQLFDFLRIPSVSTQPAHRPDIERAARWLADHMRAIGLTRAEVLPTAGHPVVYGEWLEAGPQAETILIYGHYDVQPPDPLDQWLSPPFEPQVRDDNLYARGAADDKGQLFIHLKAVESYLKGAGRLPVNVKFILEGEEESGSGGLEAFVRAERDRLQATAILVSDSPMPSPQQPALLYALRGLTYMEVTVQGPDHDLHSGSYGGAVRNPAEALSGVLA